MERQKNNEKIAIKHCNNKITFSDWYNKSYDLSGKIKQTIDSVSQNIAIFLPNSIDYAIAYFSIAFSNKTIIPIGVQSKPREIKSTLTFCEVDLVITNYAYKDQLSDALNGYPYQLKVIYIDDMRIHTYNQVNNYIKKTEHFNSNNYDDVAIMLHTSGTTSDPKRVMLTHNNLISNVESNIKSLCLNQNDVVLISMPMHFGYCNTSQFLTHLYLGASMVILDGMFLPKLFLETIQRERVTNFTGVPSTLLMLLNYRYGKNYDISSLRYVCIGGANMPANKLKELIDSYKTVGFVFTYGQSEASTRITALMPEDILRKPGSVGLPIPDVLVKVIDKNGKEVKVNELGEVIIQGENVMKGYYKQEQATKETIINGWLHSKDLGYIDDEGYLYIIGRIRNIIISGGLNIYPEEIEEVLMQHPNIKEICVQPTEHPLLGEIPIAKIVLKQENGAQNFREYCMDKLSDFKIPARFIVVDQLEKTYNGKIKRV